MKLSVQFSPYSRFPLYSTAFTLYVSVSQSDVLHTRAVYIVHWAPVAPKRRARHVCVCVCAKKHNKVWGPRKSDKWRSPAIRRLATKNFYILLKVFAFRDVMLCYWAPLPDVSEDHNAFICRVKQFKSTASLGSSRLQTSDPQKVSRCGWYSQQTPGRCKSWVLARSEDFSSSTFGNDRESLCWNCSPCRRVYQNAPKSALLVNVWKRSAGLESLQSAPIARRDRCCWIWLLLSKLKAEEVHVSSFVFSPLLCSWRHCWHTNCRQLRCDTINMTPSVVM